MKNKISIVTVTKNDGDKLEKTIESVANQTYQNLEYVIVDGESTDDTAHIVGRHREHIDKFLSEKDSGIYDAMNKGTRLSTGDYVLFLNAGDQLVSNDTLSDISTSLGNHDLVVGKIRYESGSYKPKKNQKINRGYLLLQTLPHQATFIRRALFDRLGFYDTNFRIAGDYDFFLRCIVRNNCSYIQVDKVVCQYDRGGISNNKANQRLVKVEKECCVNKYFSLSERYISKLYNSIKFLKINTRHGE